MKKFLLLFPILITSNFLWSQNVSYLNQKAVGLSLSNGLPLYELPEGGFYQPFILNTYYRLPVFKTKNAFNLQISFKPQYAGLYVNQHFHHETGLNVGFDLSVRLSDNSMLTYSTGSGPHFITYQSRRQAKGFIFSDNFLLVFRKKTGIDSDFEFEIFSGIRHISNAGIKRPNGGINNWIIGFSLGKLL
ncbi:MAG TPA: acyloxyacyl hydrolase [Bacteroidia bacterium]|nr:acyloxyacyl hydrolase [Bacteroidia bacterium]HRS57673.1 acyloxyacyl hydrolase [Bacteroidia bacterium]HRU67112.1 acyloxyacyl hydrolase [Bacteroidia bacterium]